MRLFQGVAIDRFGAGRIWSLSLPSVVVSLIDHLFVRGVETPTIFLVRISYAT
jgi:hypothetical protein